MSTIPKDHWQRQIAGLDPETEFGEIVRILGVYEFPWDTYQSLSLALFRTYAVPSIGRLLYDTGQFTGDAQRRHDDTAAILFTISESGIDSARGHAAIRRMNQMHGEYDISNDDMRYVLSTFVVVPGRWIEEFGWRQRTPAEVLASVRYWQRLGRLMGITDIPETYDEFATLLDDYETEHYARDDKTRAVADATIGLFETFYPRPLHRLANLFVRALMDEPLLDAFGYARPPATFIRAARLAIRARARFVALKPARQTPKLIDDYREIRSYPQGFLLEHIGTFPDTRRSRATNE